MNTRSLLMMVFTCFLPSICALKDNFNFPYYFLLGGIENSVDQPFKKFVTDYGYPVEVHTNIQTEDGYLLTLFRIPHGLANNKSNVTNKPVALLVHGILLSAEDWIVLGPGKSLAFILADAGYDVWLANARGSTHSRKHVKYDPTWDGKFWDFSFHEIGYYDLKTNVDYILSTTKQEQLYYIGHSQGGTTFFILNALRPEYNKRFKVMVGLAPAILIPNSEYFFFRILSLSNAINNIVFEMGFRELLPHFKLYSFIGKNICQVKGIPQNICRNVHFSNLGGISQNFNESLMPKLLEHECAGASLKQAIHYGQLVKNRRFSQYDYGMKINLEIYGSEEPPEYNLTNVVVPIAYYYGKTDIIIVLKDQKDSIKLLPNVVENYLVPSSEFTHMDMIMGNDAPILVNERVLKLFEKY